MMKRNAWLLGTAATLFALTAGWAEQSEAQRNRNGVSAADQARRAVQIRNNVRRARNLQDARLVIKDAEALTGRELTADQQKRILEAVTERNLAIETAQNQYRQSAQTLLGDDADPSQASNAQRQQLRGLAEVRDDAIRAARDGLQQSVASILRVTVDQLAARSEELKVERQLQQINGRPLTEDQKTKLRGALAARTEAIEAAQSQYRQSARELLPNANGTRLTEAQKRQLRPLAATRDSAIRAAQDAFNQAMGLPTDAPAPRQEQGDGDQAAEQEQTQ